MGDGFSVSEVDMALRGGRAGMARIRCEGDVGGLYVGSDVNPVVVVDALAGLESTFETAPNTSIANSDIGRVGGAVDRDVFALDTDPANDPDTEEE